MHVTVVKREIVDKHPWVPQSLMRSFEESKKIAYKRLDNPRVVPLAWWAYAWEEQRRILGPDPWEYGLTPRNTRNLEVLLDYTFQQGLVGRKAPLSELFVA
jgi:4,5-dihydroxyphthalate decarboxylase